MNKPHYIEDGQHSSACDCPYCCIQCHFSPRKRQPELNKEQLCVECVEKCDHDNLPERDDDVICAACGEHSNTEECNVCGENFGTSCCGARSRF